MELRQKRANASERLDDICMEVPKTFYKNVHGAHRWCYTNFTNTSRFLKRKGPAEDDEVPCSAKRRRSSELAAILFPANKCLFCDRSRKKVQGKEERLVKCVTSSAEESIKAAAEKMKDANILAKVQDVDLIATIRRAVSIIHAQMIGMKKTDVDTSVVEQQNAHAAAFEHVCQYVENSIIHGANVERVTMLKDRYLQFMLSNSPEFYNVNYKTDKIKAKLTKKFGSKIQFWQPNYRSELVYSTEVPKGQAIESAFEVAASDLKRLEEAALLLRRLILGSKEESTEMPWPPSPSFLLSGIIHPPTQLQDFLSWVITGKKFADASTKRSTLVDSFAEDICQALTRGQWTMPKHFLLGMTLRHFTGSAEIVTLLNRYGHCVSYSRLLELETAMCKSIVEREGVIPPSIQPAGNVVSHLCWDNFDLNEETPSGTGTTHTAHGIMIQEVLVDACSNPSCIQVPVLKNKQRSVVYNPQEIEPCFVNTKTEPSLVVSISDAPQTDTETWAQWSDTVWVFCRALLQNATQMVPGWAGWVTMTAKSKDDKDVLSTVDYMAPVNAPVTENATVQHLLKLSQAASREVGQHYTFVTFDLAVAKKAYALVWQNNRLFEDVIVRMGVFHTTCAYLGALGKRLQSSGFEEIVVEAGICASGSINKVMSGKHYNRALRVHRLTLEALERLLLRAFETSEGQIIGDETRGLLQRLSLIPSKENLSETLANNSCTRLLMLYNSFKEKVRKGEMGKTAQFWLDYMDKVWLVLMFLRATKENNLDLHLWCLQNLCRMFFSYDRPNYARYTTVYMLTLLNLPSSHPGGQELLRLNGFSVNRSEVQSSRNAVDLTIEQTINRHAKSHGGIIGFSRNYSAYYRWCMTRHSRAGYVQATMELTGMESQGCSTHKDIRTSEILRSETDVRKVVDAITSFINPFDVEDKDVLYCLSSRVPAPPEVEQDLLSADNRGKILHEAFVKERLIKKEKSFHEPIKKQKLKTFASLAKSVKVTGTDKKTKNVVAQRNVFGQLILLALKYNISMEKVLSYPLGPIPWALATATGSPTKTDKAKLMHTLEGHANLSQRPTNESMSYIIDGNALLQTQVSIPETFGELAESLFAQLPKVRRIDFVTDTYRDMSIKEAEREHRGASSTHLIKSPLTKIPRDWKKFLRNSKNKTQLTKLLLLEWKTPKYSAKLVERRILFVCERDCTSITSSDGKTTESEDVEELHSTQEEADTRMILHCLHVASHSSSESTIVIRSPDTDVFLLLLKFAQDIQQRVLFDTGVGNKRRMIDVHRVIAEAGKDICSALPALHAFSGCDTTSSFVRKGKLLPLKTLKDHPDFLATFLSLGSSPDVSDTLYQTLEHFTCLLYRKKSTSSDINKLRTEQFLERFKPKSGSLLTSYNGVDLSILPPCRASLRMHIQRANYQALVWCRADQAMPDVPTPDGHGWCIVDGELDFQWTEGDLMPKELVDLYDEPEEDLPEVESFEDVIFEDTEE